MVPPQYRPDETAEEIFSEHTWLQGAFLAAIAYGIQAILFFMLLHKLVTARRDKQRNMVLIIYITVMFIFGTLYMAGLLEFTQQSFIDGRNIPGGPNTYENIMFSLPIDMLANVLMVMVTWMCDIINVWRCYVVYLGGRVPAWTVIVLPVMMYMTSVALGILFLKQVGRTSGSPWETVGINWTIPYYSMSLALNILVTVLIAVRLFYYRNRIGRVLGESHGRQYTSMAAIVVESAAIYSAFSLLFLVPFAFAHPISQLFLQALSPIQIVTTLLILFRVAQGKVWTRETYDETISTTFEMNRSKTSGNSRNRRPPPATVRIQTTTSIFTESQRDADSINMQPIDKVVSRASDSEVDDPKNVVPVEGV